MAEGTDKDALPLLKIPSPLLLDQLTQSRHVNPTPVGAAGTNPSPRKQGEVSKDEEQSFQMAQNSREPVQRLQDLPSRAQTQAEEAQGMNLSTEESNLRQQEGPNISRRLSGQTSPPPSSSARRFSSPSQASSSERGAQMSPPPPPSARYPSSPPQATGSSSQGQKTPEKSRGIRNIFFRKKSKTQDDEPKSPDKADQAENLTSTDDWSEGSGGIAVDSEFHHSVAADMETGTTTDASSGDVSELVTVQDKVMSEVKSGAVQFNLGARPKEPRRCDDQIVEGLGLGSRSIDIKGPSGSSVEGLGARPKERKRSYGSGIEGINNKSKESEDRKDFIIEGIACVSYGNYYTISGLEAASLRSSFTRNYPLVVSRQRQTGAPPSTLAPPPAAQCPPPAEAAAAATVPPTKSSFNLKGILSNIRLFPTKVFRRQAGPGNNARFVGEGHTRTKSAASRVKNFFRQRSRSFAVTVDDEEDISDDGSNVEETENKRLPTLPSTLARRGSNVDASRVKSWTVFMPGGGGDGFDVTSVVPEESETESDPGKNSPGREARFREKRCSRDQFLELYRSTGKTDVEALKDGADVSRGAGIHLQKYDDQALPPTYLIWKDKQEGEQLLKLPHPSKEAWLEKEIGVSGSIEDLIYTQFLMEHNCHNLMPDTSRLMLLDTNITVKTAFFALLENSLKAAPLWNSARQDFEGILTITDFIEILRNFYYNRGKKISDMSEQKICDWMDELHKTDRLLVCVHPDDTVLQAVRSLCEHKVHRLLVLHSETGNALHILTHKRILHFLHTQLRKRTQPSFMQETLETLNLGTYNNIATTTLDSPLIQALDLFVERRISALPIVDKVTGKVTDIYAKSDVIGLADGGLYVKLDITMEEALDARREYFERVLTCKKSETLSIVVNRIVTHMVHRLVVVDDDERVLGIVSLSDVLKFLVLCPIERQRAKHDERVALGYVDPEDSNPSGTSVTVELHKEPGQGYDLQFDLGLKDGVSSQDEGKGSGMEEGDTKDGLDSQKEGITQEEKCDRKDWQLDREGKEKIGKETEEAHKTESSDDNYQKEQDLEIQSEVRDKSVIESDLQKLEQENSTEQGGKELDVKQEAEMMLKEEVQQGKEFDVKQEAEMMLEEQEHHTETSQQSATSVEKRGQLD